MHNVSRYVPTLLVMAVFCLPALGVPKAAVIRRDGSFVVEPKIGPIKALGDDWFVYSIPKKPGPGCFIWMVKPDGQKSLVAEPDGAEISCGRFEPGVAQVRGGKEGSEPEVVFYCSSKGKQGLINQHGKFILEPKYGYIGDIAEGHFAACEDRFAMSKPSKLLVFDENGVHTGSADGYTITGRCQFSGGIAPVCDEHHKIGFIDFTGRLVVPCQYDYFVRPRLNGYEVDSEQLLIDRHGAVTKHHVPDANSDTLSGIDDAFLTEISSSGRKNYGVIDKNDKVILPNSYDQIQCVPSGFLAKGPDGFHLFDSRGVKVLDFPVDVVELQIGREELIGIGVKNRAAEKGDKIPLLWGFMNRAGRIVIEPQFYAISAFEHGVAAAYVLNSFDERKCGLIDAKGKWVLNQIYDSATAGKNLFAVVIPEPHHFSPEVWNENWDHSSDLHKLFRDKKVIGMSREELQKLIGKPAYIDFDYSSYVVGSGIDTSLMIDFAFDKNSKVYKWRKRMVAAFEKANRDFPAWSTSNKYL